MLRRIINIDKEKCNGCGLCVKACHEGAIAIIEGKAVLIRDDHCDGLGDCLPACPTGAITFVEREAAPYDEAAVAAAKKAKSAVPCGCPGSMAKTLAPAPTEDDTEGNCPSYLGQWPVQIKLLPINAPYFENADLLIAADCTAFAYGNFHRDFIRGHITLIGCPKLDAIDYSEKLAAIFAANEIKSITVTRMTVPCCGGLPAAVQRALEQSGKDIPIKTVIISPQGRIME